MNTPFVSVIIPNYNHARFLDERIQSVLNQTYQNFEVIILDDKSTDNSIEVINKYKDDSHVSHVVINGENSGSPFKQWHKGFKLAKGDWIWLAESDDCCDPKFLETLTGFVDNDVSFAFCRSKRIGVNGESIEDHWQDVLKDTFTMKGNVFIKEYLLQKCVVWNASSVIFRRDYALSIPHDYMNFRGGGDWLFWLFFSNRGNVTFVNIPLNYFRLHGDNTTQKTISSGVARREKIKIYQILAKYNNYYK